VVATVPCRTNVRPTAAGHGPWGNGAVIDHRYRCIFVHIPKTAGSSVQRLFGLDWHNHKDIGRFAR
jgi:hypothetical protein